MGGLGDDNADDGPPPRPSPPRRARESIVIEGHTVEANLRRALFAPRAFAARAPLIASAVGAVLGVVLTAAFVYATRLDYGALVDRVAALEAAARGVEAVNTRVAALEGAAQARAKALDARVAAAEAALAASGRDAAAQRAALGERLSKMESAVGNAPERLAALEARPVAEGLDEVKASLARLRAAAPDPVAAEALTRKVAELETGLAAQGASVKAALARLQASAPDRQATDALARRLGVLEAARPDSSVAALDARLVQLSDDLARLDDAAAVERRDSDALQGRLVRVETALFAAKGETRAARAGAAAAPEAPPTARALAAYVLRDRLNAGEPLGEALAALDRLGVEPAALAPLRIYAERGPPSPLQLAQAFGELAPRLAPASGSLRDWMQGLVQVRKLGETPPREAEGGVPQVEAALSRGDLAAALSAMPTPPPAVRDAAKAWTEKVAARLQATKAAAELLRRSLADLGAR